MPISSGIITVSSNSIKIDLYGKYCINYKISLVMNAITYRVATYTIVFIMKLISE